MRKNEGVHWRSLRVWCVHIHTCVCVCMYITWLEDNSTWTRMCPVSKPAQICVLACVFYQVLSFGAGHRCADAGTKSQKYSMLLYCLYGKCTTALTFWELVQENMHDCGVFTCIFAAWYVKIIIYTWNYYLHRNLSCCHVHFRCLVRVRMCVCGCVVCVWMCVRVCSSVCLVRC